MLATLYNSGARVSELIGMQVGDLIFDPSASVRIRGKGRKERSVPLWRETATQLKRWLQAYPRAPEQPLFPNRSGTVLTRVGLTERLKLAAKLAARQFPELHKRRIFPHLIRHSIAMKERALKTLQPPSRVTLRYKPTDKVLQFLQSL